MPDYKVFTDGLPADQTLDDNDEILLIDADGSYKKLLGINLKSIISGGGAYSQVHSVADAAARAGLTPSINGEMCIQRDTGELWRSIMIPGSGVVQWVPIMPNPADATIVNRLEYDPNDANLVTWVDDRLRLEVVTDNTNLTALPLSQLTKGKLVFNLNDQTLYEFIAKPSTLTRTMADWKAAGGGSTIKTYNRAADLPAAGGPVAGDMAIVKFHGDGVTPLNVLYVAQAGALPNTVSWLPVAHDIFTKATRGATDMADPQDKDMEMTLEAGHKEIRIWDSATGAWITLYSEDMIKNLIAAGNLFTGTAQETAHGTIGAIDTANMPAETALSATDKGHYWIWVGSGGHVIGASEIGGAVSSIDGSSINVGDWIQVAEPTTGTYQYTVISGDLLAKARGDALYGMNAWSAGAYESGSLVVHQGKLYKASGAILATDPAPDDPANTKWTAITISAGIRNVPLDNNLPATAPIGELYLVINSAQASGRPALWLYDTPTSRWLMVGGTQAGTGAAGQAMDLSGGRLLYDIGLPIGAISMFAADVLPAGWLRCDGSAFDPIRFPTLASVLGDTHTPDLRGQFIRSSSSNLLDNFAKHQWTTGRPRTGFTGVTDQSGTHHHPGGFHIGPGPSYAAGSYNMAQVDTGEGGNHQHNVTINGGGDTETAPDHVIVHLLIKAEEMNMKERVV